MSAALARSSRTSEALAVLCCAALAAGTLATKASGPAGLVISATCVLALLAWIVWQDLRSFTIPDGAVIGLALVATEMRWAAATAAGEPLASMFAAIALDALLPGGLLLLFREVFYRRRGYDGLGLGDVKLAAAGGVLVGCVGLSWAIFAASLLGLGFIAVRRVAGRPIGTQERIAFGVLLAPALWFVWVAEQMLPAAFGG